MHELLRAPIGLAFLIAAGVAVLGLMWHLGRCLNLQINARVFIQQIEKLVRAQNMDRTMKLASVHQGPVCRLTRVGLIGLQSGKGPYVAAELQGQLPNALAPVLQYAWLVRLAGGVAIVLGVLALREAPQAAGGIIAGLVLGVALSFQQERRFRLDLDHVVKKLGGLAHAG